MTDKGNQVTTVDESKTSIWRFQWLFASQVADKAQRIFNNIDNKLNPRIFLIGIPVEPKGEEVPACLEPADECGYQPELFSGVMELARQVHEEQEEKRLFGKSQEENGQQREIPPDAIQRAILKILSDLDIEQGVMSYCSLPTTVGNHKVCCVLQLNADAFHSHHSLEVKQVMSTRLPASLVDSAAVEFLKVCSKGHCQLNLSRKGMSQVRMNSTNSRSSN